MTIMSMPPHASPMSWHCHYLTLQCRNVPRVSHLLLMADLGSDGSRSDS